MKPTIFVIIFVLFNSSVFSQIIVCKSAKWLFAEFNQDGSVKSKTTIDDAAKLIFESYSTQNPSNGIIIDLNENGKTNTLIAEVIQKSSTAKNSYTIKFLSKADNSIRGVDFDNRIGTIIYNKELIFIQTGDYGLLLSDYITEISIE